MDTQWHSHDGPDELSNGIALEPTAHKLFDVGAWSLSDDRRIIVSSHLTGTDETITRIRGHHGEGNHLLAKEKLESRFSRKELEGLTIDDLLKVERQNNRVESKKSADDSAGKN